MIPIKYNLRNLVVRWKTTLLTAVGFLLVVALLVVMMAFVEGLNELAKKSGPPGNVIVLRDGANDELFSEIGAGEDIELLYQNRDEVVACPAQKHGKMVSHEVYSIATQELPPAEEGGRPTYRFLQVRGIDEPEVSGQVHGLPLKDGRWFEQTGTEVVMGDGIARTLGLKVGGKFSPRAALDWTVVGILDSRGSPFDSEIWAKREDVGRYFGKDSGDRRFYTSIVVQTPDESAARQYADTIQERATDIRVNPMTERKYYEEMSKSNQTFQAAAIFIAVIMAIGGMFGLMNTMFAAVSQRVKDIGVLRIMGYGKGQILVSFLLESLLIALIGGGLGILLGYIVNGVEQASFVSSGRGGGKTVVFSMVVNQTVLLIAVTFTLVMGVLGGLLPALSAMWTKPLDALR